MYELNYVEYDKSGLLKVKCMRCGATIADRVYIDVRTADGSTKTVPQFMKLQNYRRGGQIKIKSGDIKMPPLSPMLCEDCQSQPIDNAAIIEQVKHGWILEQRASGKSEEQIEKYMSQYGSITEDK